MAGRGMNSPGERQARERLAEGGRAGIRPAGIGRESTGRASWARLLLLLPFAGVLTVPFYNSVEPTLFSVPFFYWYQMLWIVLCAAVVSIVYLVER